VAGGRDEPDARRPPALTPGHRVRFPRPSLVACGVVAAAFVTWSAWFIARSSHVSIDGRRYFVLFDDGMISMRYAWNLAHGHGPVWNPGERVEGYSNPLMVVVMAAATLVADKSVAVLLVQLLGIVVALGAACVAYRLAGFVYRDLGQPWRSVVQVAGFAWVLAYYPLAYWSLMGMETGLLTLLETLGVWLTMRLRARSEGRLVVVWGVTWALAFLARPDALLPFAVAVVWLALAPREGTGVLRRATALWPGLAIVGAAVVGLQAFRLAYYGAWVPNTYVLKMTGLPMSLRLEDGLRFIRPFLVSLAPAVVVAVFGLVLAFRWEKLLIVAVAAALAVYQVSIGGDFSNYWRMLAPGVAMLGVLVCGELVGASRWVLARSLNAGAHRGRTVLATGLALVGALVCLGWADHAFYREVLFVAPAYSTGLNARDVDRAVAVERVMDGRGSVGVFFAGTVPYYTGLPAVDFFGKADPHIARVAPDVSGSVSWDNMTSVPGHNKYDLTYSIEKLRPTYVQGFVWRRDDVTAWARDQYVVADVGGVTLYLLRDSGDVDWSQVDDVRTLP